MTNATGPIVSSYTRRQALADGVLLDATDMAREAGFRIPVALTCGVWSRCVAVPLACPGQDEAGRLWDILWMLRYAATMHGEEHSLLFELYVQNEPAGTELIVLKAHCGPGDAGEPVVTVMLPDED